MFRSTRLLAGTALAGALVLGAAAPAMAYDCFNASRSAQGNTAAANSGQWYSIPEFLAVAGFSSDQIAAIMPVVKADSRIPVNLTVFYNEHHPSELAHKISEALATNGKGIDHSDDLPTPAFQALFEDVAGVLGGA